jgi:acetyl-CoA C-acetyltransferase
MSSPNQTNRAFVFAVARTPFGRFRGALGGYSSSELGALAIDEVLTRASIPGEAVDGVIAGAAMLGGAALTSVRQAVLRSRLPQAAPSLGVDRACCSGMSAIALAATEVRAGSASAVICGGFESLSNTPLLLPRVTSRTGDVLIEDPLLLRSPFSGGTIAKYTSEEAARVGIDRACQDSWAVRSHVRYHEAEREAFFAFERFSVPARPSERGSARNAELSVDEGPRSDTSVEALTALPVVRGSATITAGNAPGLSDGAAFVMLGSDQLQRTHAVQPLAEVLSWVRVAEGPNSGTRTPAIAIQRLLALHDMRPEQLHIIEINEAFAATPLVSTLVLADFEKARAARIRQVTNPNGGAVAIGHPMGASGARLVMTVVAALRRRGGGLGVAAICGGFGQGEAMLVRVDG